VKITHTHSPGLLQRLHSHASIFADSLYLFGYSRWGICIKQHLGCRRV